MGFRVAMLGVEVPDGYEHVGWVDQYGNVYGKHLRSGGLRSDRPLFAALPALDVDPDAQVRGAS